MEYSQIVVEHFRNVLHIHPETSISLAKTYGEYTHPNHGKFDEYFFKGSFKYRDDNKDWDWKENSGV